MPQLASHESPVQPLLRVLIAEGLPLVRALLGDLLTARPEVTVIAEVTVRDDLLPRTRRTAPDLVLLDWALGGLGALQALRALEPAPAVIMLVPGADAEYCAAVLAHGGAACLPREYLHRVLPGALRQVIADQAKGVPLGKP